MSRYTGYNQSGFANSTVAITRASAAVSTPINYGTDPVSLYLPFDSDVQDASANNHTVTAYGDAAISSAQSKFGGNSLAVDGNGDYLSIPDSNSFNFENGDFTIECFIRPDSINTSGMTSSVATFVDHDSNAGTTGAWFSFSQQNATLLWSVNNGTLITTSSCLSAATWHHVVAVRSGNTTTIYCDGVNVGSASDTQNYTDSTSRVLYIGKQNSNTRLFTGYIDDLRITKGAARYMKNFIPPSAAVGATLNGTNETNTTTDFTSLYLPFDSDVNDDSPNSHSVTASGSAAISSAQTKFGSNSLYVSALTDFLSVDSSADFEFKQGDFTIEMFIRPDTIDTSYSGNSYAAIIDYDASNLNGAFFTLHQYNQALAWVKGTSVALTTSNCLSATTWHHIVVVRLNGTLTIYCDGNNVGSVSDSQDYDDSNTRNLYIGKQNIGVADRFFKGYIDDLRILKGFAKYTADFVSPTSAVGTSVSQTVNDLTVLYLPFDDDSFEDQARNNGVTTAGTAALNTSVKKFGTSSLFVDGNSDYAAIPDDSFSFDTKDFTVEAWLYHTGVSGNSNIFDFRKSGDGFTINMDTSGNVGYYSNKAGDYVISQSGNSIGSNSWKHLALCRHQGTTRLFIDGVLKASASDSYDYGSLGLTIGARYDQIQQWWAGYIDDLRVIQGKAIYTAAFTPPTSAHGHVSLATSSTSSESYSDNKFLSGVWDITDVRDKMMQSTWVSNDSRIPNGAGLQVDGHRWYEAPPTEHRQYRFIVLGGYGNSSPEGGTGGNGGTADYTIDTTNLSEPITLLYRQASGGSSPLVSGGHGAFISTASSRPGVTFSNILAAAGGGGGASGRTGAGGGAGGGPVGGDGNGGLGGTQSAGGSGTGPPSSQQDGKSGAFLSGGNGGVNPGGPSYERGGAGGGGYYGGGGGRGAGPSQNSSGGGGSGHANTNYTLYVTGSTSPGNRPSVAPGVSAPTSGRGSYVYMTSAPASEGTSGPVSSKTWTDLSLDNTDKFITLNITTGEYTLS